MALVYTVWGSMIVIHQERSYFYKNITNLVVFLDDNNPDEGATWI